MTEKTFKWLLMKLSVNIVPHISSSAKYKNKPWSLVIYLILSAILSTLLGSAVLSNTLNELSLAYQFSDLAVNLFTCAHLQVYDHVISTTVTVACGYFLGQNGWLNASSHMNSRCGHLLQCVSVWNSNLSWHAAEKNNLYNAFTLSVHSFTFQIFIIPMNYENFWLKM